MRVVICSLFTFFIWHMAVAQFEPNYEETKVPDFEVPDPLTAFDGQEITTVTLWMEKRRPELYEFFENKVYGTVPGEMEDLSFEVLEEDKNALEGKVVRKQVKATLFKNGKSISFTMLLYLPKNITSVPVFLGYNFFGNHSITLDTNVIISNAWAMNSKAMDVSQNKLTETSRGRRSHRWAIDKIIEEGFGLATIYYGEVDPDKHDFSDGLHALFYEKGQEKPGNNEWGSIAAWAFGMSCALDYFEKDNDIAADRVIAFGHSRLGKAALWAAARDQRFAGVISNDSGCGGAALSKRRFGETVNVINTSFPHWFCRNFKNYNNNEEALPVDQHQLLALIAPKPLYVASAQDDQWADPRGEFLSAYHASSVYKLFGKEALATDQMPAIHAPIHKSVAYHIRAGKHDVTDYDWEQYIKWAQKTINVAKK